MRWDRKKSSGRNYCCAVNVTEMPGGRQIQGNLARLLLCGFLLLAGLLAAAQEEGFYVTGRVTDDQTGEPIEFVNIVVSNTNSGTTTSELGEFILQVSQLPYELEFTHVAYETRKLRFEYRPLQPLKVQLTHKSEPLTGVTITSRRIDTLYADQIYSVLDYELCDRGVLLLIFRNRLSRAELLFQDFDGNTLSELSVLPMKPLSLYRDCLGEVHILSEDKAYQIAFTDQKMSLYDPYDLDYFAEVMVGCRFIIGARVFFEEVIHNELIKRFYMVNTLDTSSLLFAMTADEEKIAFMRDNMVQAVSADKEAELLSKLNGTPNDAATLEQIRNSNVTARFIKMAYLSAIYAPLYAMGDSVVLFNHPRNVIQFFDTLGNKIGETPIKYHLQEENDPTGTMIYAFARREKWLKQVLVDKIRNKAYTTFRNLNGTWDLQEIDLATGEARFSQHIPFPFVQKLQIRDGYMFYLYRGYIQSEKKKLFRQRIN